MLLSNLLKDRDLMLHFTTAFMLQCIISSICFLLLKWHHAQIIALISVVAIAAAWELYFCITNKQTFSQKEFLGSVAGALTYTLFIHIVYLNLTFFV